MKLKLFLSTIFAVLLFPISVNAADFSVRLGQPKTPTNQNNFKLTFVALDTRNDRNITVKCFKKGPSDAVYSQFDTDKVMIAGGNTDSCDVTSTILNADGSYSFYVTATADATTLTSSTVIVNFNNSGPSTPTSYSKEKINSCDYKIKFKTANDGKTVRVQLFRSDSLNISVGNSSVLSSIIIGPNTEGETVNSVPTCNKEYYYVIRAVDSSDNASGTIGDSFTTTTYTTSSTGVTASPTSGTGAVILSGATSQVTNPDASVDNAVSENSAVEGGVTTSPTPSVLGSSTEESKWTFTKWVLLITIAFVIYFVLRSLKGTKSK